MFYLKALSNKHLSDRERWLKKKKKKEKASVTSSTRGQLHRPAGQSNCWRTATTTAHYTHTLLITATTTEYRMSTGLVEQQFNCMSPSCLRMCQVKRQVMLVVHRKWLQDLKRLIINNRYTGPNSLRGRCVKWKKTKPEGKKRIRSKLTRTFSYICKWISVHFNSVYAFMLPLNFARKGFTGKYLV